MDMSITMKPPIEEPPRIQVGIVGDLGIRGLGLLGIGLAAAAGIWLHRLMPHGYPASPTLGQYALATVTFIAASIGCGLLILGRHIHQRIEVAERWRRITQTQPSAPISR